MIPPEAMRRTVEDSRKEHPLNKALKDKEAFTRGPRKVPSRCLRVGQGLGQQYRDDKPSGVERPCDFKPCFISLSHVFLYNVSK